MLRFQISSPTDLTDDVLRVLTDDPAVSSLAVMRGASIRPVGDVVTAHVTREAANDVVDRLERINIQADGSLQIEPVRTWMSRRGREADERAPGSSADSVVWAEVTQRAHEESELNWTFVSFMSLSTVLAAIAIVLDSQILIIGAMVLGPEFGAITALGVALVRRRGQLLGRAVETLIIGFAVAIAITAAVAAVARAAGWIQVTDVTEPGTLSALVSTPDRWSFVVAMIAASAGVLSLTSDRVGGLSGVFISVITIPAASNIALGIAFGVGSEIQGSLAQLLVNVGAMALAGWLTLAFQQAVWARVSAHRARLIQRLRAARRARR